MAKFCRSCGSALEAEARFCGECGTPIEVTQLAKSVVRPVAASIAAAPRPTLSKRGVLIAASIAVVALIGGGAAWWFTQAEELNDAVFLREAKRSVQLDPTVWDGRFCLNNYFNYQQAEIRLSDADQRSRKWFEMLAADGLYAPAQQQVVNDGWADQTIWVFQQTEKGKAALRNGRLCFANQAEFTTVSFTPPSKVGSYQIATGTVNFQAKEPAGWSQSATAKVMSPEIAQQSQGSKRIELVLVDRQWQLPTPELIQKIRQSQYAEQPQAAQQHGGSWLDKLLGLFKSSPVDIAALYGVWETKHFGQDAVVVLDADSITLMGQRTTGIIYLPSENSEWIQVKEGNVNLIELRVIDSNTLGMRFLGAEVGKMHRRQ